MSETFEIDRTGEPVHLERIQSRGFKVELPEAIGQQLRAIVNDNWREWNGGFVFACQVFLNTDNTATLRGAYYDGIVAEAIRKGYADAVELAESLRSKGQ